jgi:hypothetical protein
MKYTVNEKCKNVKMKTYFNKLWINEIKGL